MFVGLSVILRHAQTLDVIRPQIILGFGVALDRRLPQVLRCLYIIPRHFLAFGVSPAQKILRLRIAFPGRLLSGLYREGVRSTARQRPQKLQRHDHADLP
jgi:hypothetical protein